MRYSDPNVPCGRKRKARWSYGAANPGGDRNHKIFGWTVAKVSETTTRSC